MRVEPEGGTEPEETVEVGRVAPGALDPAEHRGGTHPSVGPLAVGVVRLVVAIVEEALVRGLELGPARGLRVVDVRLKLSRIEIAETGKPVSSPYSSM
jgi:hypothetical protein